MLLNTDLISAHFLCWLYPCYSFVSYWSIILLIRPLNVKTRQLFRPSCFLFKLSDFNVIGFCYIDHLVSKSHLLLVQRVVVLVKLHFRTGFNCYPISTFIFN